MKNTKELIYTPRTKLQRDLVSFGLDPQDWDIHREKGTQYKIQNKSLKSFAFKGKAAKSCKWQYITLVSL